MVNTIEKTVGDTVDHLSGLAVHQTKKPGKVGDSSRGAHAAQKAVTLDDEHVGAISGSGCGGCEARRAATDDNYVKGSEHGRFTGGFTKNAFHPVFLPTIRF